MVSEKGIATDADKTSVIANWPTPLSKKDLQQFLGLANYYRRFVRDFATLVRPLQRLTQKNVAFEWTSICQSAFDPIPEGSNVSTSLAFLDYSREFILDTDACDCGTGGILSQIHDEGEVVIAHASTALSRQQRRYCVTCRELLAVIEIVHHFRHYRLGQHFTLRTYHGSLVWILNFKEPEGQLVWW